VKYVLLYESGEDLAERAPEHVAAHSEWVQQFHHAGTLLMMGPFSETQRDFVL